MRITNGMMINNSLANINVNKLNVDKLSTQQSTGKKIQKPSDDPIIAVRALRFRSQLTELSQYLTKNIPDAESWMNVTEDALSGVSEMMQNMQQYFDQAANDTYNVQNRKDIADTLRQYKEQIFQDANADYAGRRVFAGFKTDTDMTFSTGVKQRYDITEKITTSSIGAVTKIKDQVSVGATPETISDEPALHEVYRIRLSYEKLSYDQKVTLKDTSTTPPTNYSGIDVVTVAADENGVYRKVQADGTLDTSNAGIVKDIYSPSGNNEAYLLADSGELILSDSAYQTLSTDMGGKTFSVSYTKENFEKNDLRPEQYFDCVSYAADGTTKENTYTSTAQDILYTVNFNQKLKVNTEGKNAFTHDIVRDLDELLRNVEAAQLAQTKVDNIKSMMNEQKYSGEADQTKLKSMLEAAEKELVFADDIMQKSFEKGITKFQNHQKVVDAEVADVGSRTKRLILNKERLTSQKTVYEELKSSNEDIDLPETIIRLAAASMVYESSLSASSKIVTKSLLDYL